MTPPVGPGTGEDALRRIVPSEVALAVIEGDADEGAGEPLFEVERAALGRAVPRRVRDFERGRACARAALGELGVPRGAIPVGPMRQPLWPSGFVGSITHCDGLCAAAVARASDLAGLGIDAEVAGPLDADLVARIATVRERAWLASRSEPLAWAKLLFSVKESVYKATFPSSARFLEFEEVEVELDLDRLTFSARWPLGIVRGAAAVSAAHVLACAWLPPA